jgi:hypothetical protein
VMFSMARDTRLPFSKLVSKVNKRTGTPLITGTTVSALAILVLLVNLQPGRGVRGHHQCVGGDRVPGLSDGDGGRSAASVARHQPELRPPIMDLGKWGIPVNLIAAVMGARPRRRADPQVTNRREQTQKRANRLGLTRFCVCSAQCGAS